MAFRVYDAAATEQAARLLAPQLRPGDVLALYGDLGAGKTTFARALIRALGTADEDVPSPSFSIVQQYETRLGPLWHCDFYRLETGASVAELGLEQALAERAILVIEWPDRLGPALPADRLDIRLTHPDGFGRLVEYIPQGQWQGRPLNAGGGLPVAALDFAAAAGWPIADVQHVSADFTSRGYARLRRASPPQHAILMVEESGASLPAWLQIGTRLRGLGLRAPEVYAARPEQGVAIIEDFGDRRLGAVVDGGGDPLFWYRRGLQVLIRLQQGFREQADDANLPRFNAARFAEQAAIVVDFYAPRVLGHDLPRSAHSELRAAWCQTLAPLDAMPTTLLLRDYHVDNLMDLGAGDGADAVGVLDFQDAGIGPLAYDVVSLLEESRRSVPPAVRAALLAEYHAAMPALVRADWELAYDLCGAQRQFRILGIFANIVKHRSRPDILKALPLVWDLFLAKAAARPAAMRPVMDWLDAYIPLPARVAHWQRAA